jgi:hypothetical protein
VGNHRLRHFRYAFHKYPEPIIKGEIAHQHRRKPSEEAADLGLRLFALDSEERTDDLRAFEQYAPREHDFNHELLTISEFIVNVRVIAIDRLDGMMI